MRRPADAHAAGTRAAQRRRAEHARTPRAAGASRRRRRRGRRRSQWFEADPLWFKRAVFYEIHIRGFFDANGDGSGDFRGLTEKLDYLAVARDRLHLAAAVLRLAAARRRLRHRRLHRGPPRLRHGRRRPRADRRRPRARHPRDRRPGDEPHLERPPVVPGVALEPGLAQARLVRVVGHATTATRTRGSSSSTPRPRTGPGTRSPAPYYWHRFFSHQPDLNYDNPEVQEAMLDVLRFWLDLGLDGFRLDAVPYLFEREGTNCENLPETHAYLKRVRSEIDARLPRPGAARRGQPVAGGRRRVLRRRRRVPDGVPLPGDAADVHGGPARGGGADLRDPRADAGDPRQLPVGPVPAQPRRADARDGHRRGARLHVRRVRQGPADEAQPRDPPAARAAARQRPRRDRADDRDPVLAARLARSSTTATRSRWATTSSSATATACARRCSGPATATAASRAPTSPSCTRRR